MCTLILPVKYMGPKFNPIWSEEARSSVAKVNTNKTKFDRKLGIILDAIIDVTTMYTYNMNTESNVPL